MQGDHGSGIPPARFGERGVVLASLLLCLLVGALARPGPLRPAIALEGIRATPSDQEVVAAAVGPWVERKALVFMERGKLLFLLRRTPALPLIYFNIPARLYFRSSPES